MTDSTEGPNDHLIHSWTALWNGDLAVAAEICAAQVTIRFGGAAIGKAGDRVRGPDALAELIGDFRSGRKGLTYSTIEVHTTDTWGHCVWDAVAGERHVGGIDTFEFENGRILTVRSVTGERSVVRAWRCGEEHRIDYMPSSCQTVE